MKAAEIKGNRYVGLRDPWGELGWQGAWSDGSKEWTTEWLEVLPELGHIHSVVKVNLLWNIRIS